MIFNRLLNSVYRKNLHKDTSFSEMSVFSQKKFI